MTANSSLSDKLSSNRALLNWLPTLLSPKAEASRTDYRTNLARAWDSYRHQTLARSIVGRITINAVSDGLRPHPDINAGLLGDDPEEIENLEDIAEAEFNLYAKTKDIDIRRMKNFDELQLLYLANLLVSGESFVNTPTRDFGLYATKIQFIEPERVCNKNFMPDTKYKVRGVNLNEDGAPISYEVMKDYPNEILLGSNPWEWFEIGVFSSYGRRRFLHSLHDDRINTVRGDSIFLPLFETLKNSDRLDESELMGSLLSSFLTFFVESPSLDDDLDNPVETFGGADKQSNPANPDSEYDFVNMGPAAILELKNGKKMNPFISSRPNASYEAFSNAIAKKISAAAGLPFEEILMAFTSSYSSSRAAMVAAWRLYKIWRKFVVDNFCHPIYEVWFDEAVAKGVLPVKNYGDPRRRLLYTQAKWRGDQRGSIDPLQEISAAAKAIESGISSVPIEVDKRGDDWEEVVKTQRQYEQARGIKGSADQTLNQTGMQSQVEGISDVANNLGN